jgi:hypothetical protein
MKRVIKVGDLVRMHTHDTGLVGIVVDMHPHANHPRDCQVGIKWFKGSGDVNWEPEGWLEVVSEGR